MNPPEKLVLEIQTHGRFFALEWRKDGNYPGSPGFSAGSFTHFNEVYYIENASAVHVGRYEVRLIPFNGTAQVPPSVIFDVISHGILYVWFLLFIYACMYYYTVDAITSAPDTIVIVTEGTSVNISCTSFGVPVPTISWTLNGHNTTIKPTDEITDLNLRDDGKVIPGYVVSTLLITDAQYLTDEGEYVCTGSNADVAMTSTMITLIVLGKKSFVGFPTYTNFHSLTLSKLPCSYSASEWNNKKLLQNFRKHHLHFPV